MSHCSPKFDNHVYDRRQTWRNWCEPGKTQYSTTPVRRCAPEFLDGHTVLELVVLKPSIEVAVRLHPYAPADVDNGFEGLEKNARA